MTSRSIASVVLALFFNQFLFASFAQALSQVPNSVLVDTEFDFTVDFETSADIETVINSRPDFIESNSTDILYQKAEYVDDSYLNSYRSFGSLKEQIKSTKSAGDSILIPVMVGDITVFVPTFPQLDTPLVGDKLVNERLINLQISNKLGRNLIHTPEHPRYTSEKQQFESLYNNAISLAKTNIQVRYGERLPFNASNLPYDLIWPEKHLINGKEAIVPMLYLTQSTINTYSIDGNLIELSQGGTVQRVDATGVDISLGRDSVLEALSDITITNGSISSSDELTLIAGGTLSLLSSKVDATGDVKIAAKSVNAQTLVHRYDLGQQTGTRYGQITEISSESGDVTVRSYGDMNFAGANVNAGGGITFGADGSIFIGSVQLQESFNGREGRWKVQRSEVDYLISQLSASDTISIIANGGIQIEGADIASDNGHIELLAGLGISVVDNVAQYNQQRKGKFGNKKIDESVYQTVAIRSVLDAGKGVVLHTKVGDITLKAVDINSTEGTKVKADSGGVNLLMTTETDHYSYSSVKEGMFTIATKNKGHNIEKGVMNTVVGGMTVEALKGVKVEYAGDPNLTPAQQLEVLSQSEGMQWLTTIQNDPKIKTEFEAIMLEHKTWSESNRSLTPAAMAVITIAVAIATSGAGATLIGAGGVGASAGSLALGAAANAAFTSIVTTAATSLAAGNSVAATLDTLGSDENLKSLAVSMVTAAALSGVDSAFTNETTDQFNAAAQTNGTQELVDAAKDGVKAGQTAAEASQSLANQVAQATVNSAVTSGIRTIANGGSLGDFGDNFVDSMLTTAVNNIGEHMVTEIGDSFKAGDINNAIRYIAHAATGCMIGTATGGINETGESSSNCATGAGGAVVGELIADVHKSSHERAADIEELESWMAERGLISQAEFESLSPAEKQALSRKITNTGMSPEQYQKFREIGIDSAKLGAAITALMVGADVTIAANTAENAAANNALPLAVYAAYIWVAASFTLTVVDGLETIQGVVALSEELEGKSEEEQQKIIIEYAKAAGIDLAIDIGAGITGTKLLAKLAEKADSLAPDVQRELGRLSDSYDNGGNGQNYTPELESRKDYYTSPIDGANGERKIENIAAPVPDENPLNGETISNILHTEKGDRPNPGDADWPYTPEFEAEHLAKFDEGAVRFTKSEYPDSLGMEGEKIFVMPRGEFDRIMNESGGDLNKLDDLLSFGGGLKTTTPDDWDIAFISNPKVQIPSGNESGAYPNQWIPGGFTGGGVAEAVMDHPASSDILRCSFVEVMNNSRCL